MTTPAVRARLMLSVAGIDPYDDQEDQDQAETINWIASKEPLYRTARKPPTPAKHLAVYIAVLDSEQERILLIHHRNAQLWVPAGGHVEPDELPVHAVIREAREELNMDLFEPQFHYRLGNGEPFFLTVVDVSDPGKPPHTDVTLWYVVTGPDDIIGCLTPENRTEYDNITWFNIHHLYRLMPERADSFAPGMERFLDKLIQTVDLPACLHEYWITGPGKDPLANPDLPASYIDNISAVLSAAQAYESAWNAYANPAGDIIRQDEELLLAKGRAHQALLDAVRALDVSKRKSVKVSNGTESGN